MTINISFASGSGRTLFAALKRIGDGKFWDNNTSLAWETSPTAAEVKIALTEGTGRNLGIYTATSAGNVGAATILVTVHDDNDASDAAIGCQQITTDADGNEILLNAGFARAIKAITIGTVTTGATTTSIPTSVVTPAGAVADQFKGQVLCFADDTTTAALRGQKAAIIASTNAAAPTLTVVALTTAPASGDVFTIQ